MTAVDRTQFDIKNDVQVVHKPTGARFSTYPYDHPKDVEIQFLNWGRAGDRLENGDDYEREDVRRVAHELLREQARLRAGKG